MDISNNLPQTASINSPMEMEPLVVHSSVSQGGQSSGEDLEQATIGSEDRSATTNSSFEMLEVPAATSHDTMTSTVEELTEVTAMPPPRPRVLVVEEDRVIQKNDIQMAVAPLTENNQDEDGQRMVASGVAGLVVGSLFFGPFVGAIAGFGTAYTTKKDGPAGDIARALGDIALNTRDKATEIEQKHHLVEKSKVAILVGWEKAKELDRRHHILEKAKDFVVFSWTETVNFTRRHRLLERGVQGVGKGLEWVIRRVFRGSSSNNIEGSESRQFSYERIPSIDESQRAMPGAKLY